jgi:integrase
VLKTSITLKILTCYIDKMSIERDEDLNINENEILEKEKKYFKKLKKELWKKEGGKFTRKNIKKQFEKEVGIEKVEGTWDYSIDYQKTRKFLAKLIKDYWDYLQQRFSRMRRRKNVLKLFYFSIMLHQLVNGLRSSEAINSFLDLLFQNRRVGYTLVRKKKHYNDLAKAEYTRKVGIPAEIPNSLLEFFRSNKYIYEFYQYWQKIREDNKKREEVIRNYSTICKEYFGFSPHALRHSFLTYLLAVKGYNPTLVAHITKHSNINMLKRYTSRKKAEELLEEILRNKV